MNPTLAVSIAFDPLLPWPVLAVLGAIGLVLVLLGLRAGARGTIWRLGSIAVVLAALANPALIEAGKSFGVIKLVSDPPHWSDDGH